MLKIVSGGQTGVDRAALDVALKLGIHCGGYCPKGRRAEDGTIATHYPLEETPSQDYKERTEWNVRFSDATLLLTWGETQGGSRLTLDYVEKYRKPYLKLDLVKTPATNCLLNWLIDHPIRTLNIAGPRGSFRPDCYSASRQYLEGALSQIEVTEIFDLENLCRFIKVVSTVNRRARRIGLIGNLGVGKTTLVREWIRLKNPQFNRILSPSFVIHQKYDIPECPIHHFDFYRLDKVTESDLTELGYYETLEQQTRHGGLIFVEWPERASDPLALDEIFYLEFCPNGRRILRLVKS